MLGSGPAGRQGIMNGKLVDVFREVRDRIEGKVRILLAEIDFQ
jgi:hypothetical protein